ncbi:MAG TPA: dihydroneopterin aldolase [Flavitalea sp.]|nr:dihydroneopterin aldolase [Flavitalea sp.]
MIAIELKDVHFHGYHGLYEGEEIIGGPFVVNLVVKYEEHGTDLSDINETVDYVDLFNIVKQRMQMPAPLLEKLCDSIIRHIKHQYAFITEATLSIYKVDAPIPQFQGMVGVSMTKNFKD